jgi:hypothetical protein
MHARLPEGHGWFGDPKLSEYMKKVLSEATPIPVSSDDLSTVATFSNLIIEWKAKKGSGTVTGRPIDLKLLQGAKGYAIIDFDMDKDFEDIPKIKRYISSNYPCVQDRIEVDDVEAVAYFIDSSEKIQGEVSFELETGHNVVTCCQFHKYDGQIKSVKIKVTSFKVSISSFRVDLTD